MSDSANSKTNVGIEIGLCKFSFYLFLYSKGSRCVCVCVRICQQRKSHNDKCEETKQISAIRKREKDIQLFACSMFRHTGGAQSDSICQMSERHAAKWVPSI